VLVPIGGATVFLGAFVYVWHGCTQMNLECVVCSTVVAVWNRMYFIHREI
jgi:hypothetical protein